MEIRNLNTFLRVASLQNFTRAAEELGYSQSNVSTQIKQFEYPACTDGSPLQQGHHAADCEFLEELSFILDDILAEQLNTDA